MSLLEESVLEATQESFIAEKEIERTEGVRRIPVVEGQPLYSGVKVYGAPLVKGSRAALSLEVK